MTSLSACSFCEHCRIENETVVCDAFPDGIPDKFFYSDVIKKKECDNGIGYKTKQK